MKTAVLTDDALFMPGQVEPYSGACWAGRLCELGLKHDLAVIWVCPGSQLSRQVFDDPESINYYTGGYDVRIPSKYDKPAFGSVKHISGTWEEKRIIYFGLPELDSRWTTDDQTWSLADLEQPQIFLEQMLALETALTPRRMLSGESMSKEFHVRYSPGFTGMDLMKETIKLYAHVAWIREADISMLPRHKEPGGFVWKRRLTDSEREKKCIHFFDRNAQFPAACTGAELGEGTPDYFSPEVHMHRPNLKLPGVWRVTCLPNAAYDALPFVVPEAKTWAYTPTIQAMELLGYKIEFHEGYQWPVHHRTLQDWASHMWQARQALKEQYGKDSPAYLMSKMFANRGLGWLETVDDQWRRDDWANMVRSLARFRMVLKMKELADLGYWPVMVVADNIAYVSDDSNPETAIPGLMRRSTELGGFKSDGTYLLHEVLPFLEQLDPNAIRREVKKLETRVK